MPKLSIRALLLATTATLTGCESSPQTNQTYPTPTVTPVQNPTVPGQVGAFASSGHADMDAWRDDFAERALRRGYKVEIIRSILERIEPMDAFLVHKSEVVDQAEFSKPIWNYVSDTVSSRRLTTGQEKLAADRPLFEALSARYGVQPEYLAAIWGMETSYGAFIGNFDAPSTLASMATEGRRRSFAETELLALMEILDRGDAKREWLIAGWAGALGQAQFMPSTYLAYAVDWTGDGTKDVWTARADALASAGNYLSASGWRRGEPSLVEVQLPGTFDYSLADGSRRSSTNWVDLGVKPMSGRFLDPGQVGSSELWLPAGHTGPAFLLYPNFDVIKTYNRADSYALSVSLIAEGLKGNKAPQAAWPESIDRCSIDEIKMLQAGLNKLGYDAGKVDGIAGRGTRQALQRFQKDRGLLADGFPTRTALAAVLTAG